jgi:CysZ protein
MIDLILKSFSQTLSCSGVRRAARVITISALFVAAGVFLLANIGAIAISSSVKEYTVYMVLFGLQGGAVLLSLIWSTYFFAFSSFIYGVAFQNRAAAEVERLDYPNDPPGRDAPLMKSVRRGVGQSLLSFLIAGIAWLLFRTGQPLLACLVFFGGSGLVVGRGEFSDIAQRHMDVAAARGLMRKHFWVVYCAGVVIVFLLIVPVLNLLTPIFGTILMTHLLKSLVRMPALQSVPRVRSTV